MPAWVAVIYGIAILALVTAFVCGMWWEATLNLRALKRYVRQHPENVPDYERHWGKLERG